MFNQPPKKVIRATRDYKAQFVNELEFCRGEFFYVITDLDDFYYEVMNPIARVRGLVPRSHFESLDKTAAAGTQQRPPPPSVTANAANSESPLDFLQNQLNLRQQQQQLQQREPPQSRDRDYQRSYDSAGARRSERDARSYYRGNDNSSSHMSVSAMTASTTTNYDDYKHHSSYTHGYAESDASSDTHSSAYSTVHSTDYPVSRSPVPERPHRENRQPQQQQQQRQHERPPARAMPMPAGRRKLSNDGEEESENADRRHRHSEHRSHSSAARQQHAHDGRHQHQQQQSQTRTSATKPTYPSSGRAQAPPPSASLLSKSAPSSQHLPHYQLQRNPSTTQSAVAKPISGMGGQLPHPVSARVQADQVLPDGRFQYTIELHLSDDTSRVLLRVFDDFYTLHVSLLSQFAAQSGRLRDQPRSIPFLPPAPVTPKNFSNTSSSSSSSSLHSAGGPPPQQQATPAEQARRRRALDAYLTDLVALPAPIRHSPPLNRFFMLRKGDNTLATAVRFDTSAALMDLISDYNSYPSMSRGKQITSVMTASNGGSSSGSAAAAASSSSSLDLDEHSVRIKLHLPAGDETLVWRIDEAMPFMDFVDEVAAKTRWRMRDGWAMWYKDEVGGLVKLTGDADWRLVVRGRWEKVVLYID
ncbi:bud emergence protein 1 [Geranomyces michiganensis]|nr:bud emergence protein 1 [Geranomyces michiganensis]